MHKKETKLTKAISSKLSGFVCMSTEKRPKQCVFIPSEEVIRLIIMTCSKFGLRSNREILERFGFM